MEDPKAMHLNIWLNFDRSKIIRYLTDKKKSRDEKNLEAISVGRLEALIRQRQLNTW